MHEKTILYMSCLNSHNSFSVKVPHNICTDLMELHLQTKVHYSLSTYNSKYPPSHLLTVSPSTQCAVKPSYSSKQRIDSEKEIVCSWLKPDESAMFILYGVFKRAITQGLQIPIRHNYQNELIYLCSSQPIIP